MAQSGSFIIQSDISMISFNSRGYALKNLKLIRFNLLDHFNWELQHHFQPTYHKSLIFFSSDQISPKQLNLMTKKIYENFMFKGVKSCIKGPNVN